MMLRSLFTTVFVGGFFLATVPALAQNLKVAQPDAAGNYGSNVGYTLGRVPSGSLSPGYLWQAGLVY